MSVLPCSRGPLLIVIDDLHWLDRASGAAVGFVGRRLRGSRIGLLGAIRPGVGGFFERAGLPEYEVAPLSEADAIGLLARQFVHLPTRVLRRVADEAQGNPLALLEFAASAGGRRDGGPRRTTVTSGMSREVRTLYDARIERLPEPTRRLLLLAVLDGSGDPASAVPRPPIEVHNEIVAPAGAERVWDLLTDVEGWPSWYRACRWVHVESAGSAAPTDSAARPASFRWKAHPIALRSTVVASDRPHSFAFIADARGLHAEHTFTLRPAPGGLGTVVLSHETQAGPLPRLGRVVLGPRLHATTRAWLTDLARAVHDGRTTQATPAAGDTAHREDRSAASSTARPGRGATGSDWRCALHGRVSSSLSRASSSPGTERRTRSRAGRPSPMVS